MNPYGIARPAPIDLRDLLIWNAGIQRSIDDYWRHPVSACIKKNCPALATDGYMCRTHRNANKGARQRMQARRAS